MFKAHPRNMEDFDDFGSSLYKNLHDILDWAEENQSNGNEEDILYQINRIDELLILINNISNSLEVNISVEDCEELLRISNVFDQLRKELVHMQSRRSTDATTCTILTKYFTKTEGEPGRPKAMISQEVLEELRGLGFSWSKIARILNVSRWTVSRRVEEYELSNLKRFNDITDEEVDNIIKEYINRHGATTGEKFISGLFRSKGITIQRKRIRESLNRVDPKNTVLRWGALVTRRTYYVPWPNSLWHLDGHHSLIRWKLVIHGCVDGKSRKIMYLHCSSNNLAETVRTLFLDSIRDNSNFWPSRIRVDHGVENVLVCDEMVAKRGPNRNSFIAGPSTRNQRIERLWRDVFRCVTVIFYYTFYAMEQSGILKLEDEMHMFLLHYVILPRINFCLTEFKDLYNDHRLSSEHNWTPNQIWHNGMLNHNNPLSLDLLDEDTEPEFYGEDPSAPFPFSENNNVVVTPPDLENEEYLAELLDNRIDVNRTSEEMGIDIYMEALEIIQNALYSEEQ